MKTLNIKGNLLSLDTPLVMGILNVTPDSFYAGSRKQTEAEIEATQFYRSILFVQLSPVGVLKSLV